MIRQAQTGAGRLGEAAHWFWGVFCLAVKKFSRVDGAQWAGAFAFNAFFSLVPLIVLAVAIASAFIGPDRACKEVIAYVESYVPISGEMQNHIFGTITGVIKARQQAGVVAFLILIWGALQCFTTLICATSRSWGTVVNDWWRLPLVGITAGAVLFGTAMPVLIRLAKGHLFAASDFQPWVYALVSWVIALLIVFFSLTMFYQLAPRRRTRFAEVWPAALCATALLQAAEGLFVIYLKKFSTLNAVYGAFGGIMALLLWIYLSGGICIFGACLCSARAERRSTLEKIPETRCTNSIELCRFPPNSNT
jgi:Ca2+-transporting ATPase